MKQKWKQYIASFLAAAMVLTMIPSGSIRAEGASGETVIPAAKCVASGGQSNLKDVNDSPLADVSLVATGATSGDGNEKAAAHVGDETGSSSVTVLGSDRVMGMGFELPAGVAAGSVESAVVKIYVVSVNGNMKDASKYWTKAGLFKVSADKYDGMNTDQATFPAKDDQYGKDATVFCAEQIKNSEEGFGVKTFDVTAWVKESLEAGDAKAVYRMQTVLGGFLVANTGDNQPQLVLTLGEGGAVDPDADKNAVKAAKEALDPFPAIVRQDVTLPAKSEKGAVITWKSENSAIMTDDGKVTRGDADQTVKMTATIKKGSESDTKEFTVKIGKKYANDLMASYQFEKDAQGAIVVKDASGAFPIAEVKGEGAAVENGVLTLPGGDAGSTAAYVQLPGEMFAGQDVLTITTWLKNETGSGDYAAMFFGTKTKHVDSGDAYKDTNMPVNYWLLNPSKGGKFKSVWTNGSNSGAPYSTEIGEVSASTSDQWGLYTTVITADRITGYYNGAKVSDVKKKLTTTDFGTDLAAFIGRSSYNDPFYKGGVYGVKIYDKALTEDEILEEYYESYPPGMAAEDRFKSLEDELERIMLDQNRSTSSVTYPLAFPAERKKVQLAWTPADASVIDANGGNVYTGAEPKQTSVTVVGTYKGSKVIEKTIQITVESVLSLDLADFEKMDIPNKDDVRGNIMLPTKGKYGTPITWTSTSDIISITETANENYDPTPAGVVKRPAADTKVTLKASIGSGESQKTKEYEVTVKAAKTQDKLTDYVFAYFIGNGKNADGSKQEEIYLAVSRDGMNWRELNGGKPVLVSNQGTQGLRDPYIFRSAEGDKFYIIATDLCIADNGDWGQAQTNGSQAIMVWESDDLVNWSEQRMVTVSADIEAGCTWAPEVYYDSKTGEYIVFWASKVKSDNYGKQRVYYAKTRDFYNFSTPKVWIDESHSSIDSTVIQDTDGMYYRFTKWEGSSFIYLEKASSMLGEWTMVNEKIGAGVEGPCAFKLNDDDASIDTWILLLDEFGGRGYIPMKTNNLAEGKFADVTDAKLPSKPRHGTVMPITTAEYTKLADTYAVPELKDDAIPSYVATGYTLPEKVGIVYGSKELEVGATWDKGADDFKQAGTVTVTGTLKSDDAGINGITVTKSIEVVSQKLIYLIDSGRGNWNEAGEFVGENAVKIEGVTLRNEKKDQKYTEGSWGIVNPGTSNQASDTSSDVALHGGSGLYGTGWWARNGKNCEYAIPLETGSYELTGYFAEWWNQSRPMTFYASYKDASGNSTEVIEDASVSGSEEKAVKMVLRVKNITGDSVEVRIGSRPSGGSDPVISGLAIEKIRTAQEDEQADADKKAAGEAAKEKMKEITVDPASKTLKKDETVKLTIGYPENFDALLASAELTKTVSFSSDNKEIADVRQDGTVTAIAGGTAKITASITLSNGAVQTVDAEITVEDEPEIPVKSVSLNATKLTMGVKETFVLKAAVNPKNATSQTRLWTTSNKKIVSVAQNGKITAVAKGTAKITVTIGGKSKTCAVTVKDAPKSIIVNKKSVPLRKGQTFQLKVKFPKNSACNTVIYKSSNSKIAAVSSSGKIKGLKAGKTTIKISTYNKKSITIKVTVK